MHELSLAENVLQLITDAARNEGFSRVKTVQLEIGQLACVEPEALAFAFESVARGSLAESARLEIISTPGLGRCADCGQTVAMAVLYGLCPACGSAALQIVAGDRMRVKELEVE
ncbi:MAG: hydrogenase maturation nickel metallochaperone HypA [Nitrosomonadales bacterium]|nr:hydrogenase maturation nickel metallochaperone HypA [Nitrosomonadales bacterium]